VSTTYIVTVLIGGGGALAALALLFAGEIAPQGTIQKCGIRWMLWLGAAQFVLGVLLLGLHFLG